MSHNRHGLVATSVIIFFISRQKLIEEVVSLSSSGYAKEVNIFNGLVLTLEDVSETLLAVESHSGEFEAGCQGGYWFRDNLIK